jgi:endogenous inhibitor of DNA gyrase (YacG/DUF329 family)
LSPSSFPEEGGWCKKCHQKKGDSRYQKPDSPLNGKKCPVCDTPIRGRMNRSFCSDTCRNKKSSLETKYNLTVQQYREMIDQHQGRCPICLKKAGKWHVDHDHRTRKVLGPVCSKCNMGALATTFHDPDFVRRLLDFLENPPTKALNIEAFVPEEYNKKSNIKINYG